MKTPQSLVDRLRRVAQVLQQHTDPTFSQALLAAGFKSVSEAIQVAREYQLDAKQNEVRAGELFHNTWLYRRIKMEIRKSEEFVFAFSDLPGKTKIQKQTNLGRMRALVRLAALQVGYSVPSLEGSDPRFEIVQPSDRVDYDTWGLRYKAKCVPLKGPFWRLDDKTKKELIELAKRQTRH